MKELLDLLHSDNWYGVSDKVDIVKGKHEIIDNWRDGFVKIKRAWHKKG